MEGLEPSSLTEVYAYMYSKRLTIGEWPSMTLKIITIAAIKQAVYVVTTSIFSTIAEILPRFQCT